MTTRCWRMASWVGAASLALAACTLSGYEGYDGGGVDVGYVGGYYEPWGYEYGGWGNRYWVGPPRGDRGHGRDHGPGGGHPHGGGRPVGGGRGGAPSIPSRPR